MKTSVPPVRALWLSALCAATLYASAFALPGTGADLPDGPGRDAVEAACTVCHTADRITKQKLTAEQWRGTVREMIENGASLDPDQWEPVIAYLARNFGPAPHINVNKASAREISDALGLTPAEAEAIVTYRTANGPFRDLSDLRKVPGPEAKKIDAAKDRIGF
jgi:competence ComEA-like helix-hairpin-helix protein